MENSFSTVKNSQPLTIVCAADDKYSMPLTVTLRSVITNLKSYRKVVVFVIDGGIHQANKRKILNSLTTEQVDLEIHWAPARADLLEKMKVSGHVTIATYFRLLIPNLLPDSFNKVIYLDSDLIINEDLGKLWDADLGDHHLLAVQDSSVPLVSSPEGLANYQELGIPANFKYFNGGVLVINLDKWRTENVSLKVIEYLKKNKEHVRWWDQDGLNAILAGKWGELDTHWNIMLLPHLYSGASEDPHKENLYNGIVTSPCIIHFASSSKPWSYTYKFPAKNLFFKYLDQTVWAGWRPTEPSSHKIYRSWWWKAGKQVKDQLVSLRQK